MTAMKFGRPRYARDLGEFVEWCQLAEKIGLDLIGYGDSSALWIDPFVALTLFAFASAFAQEKPPATGEENASGGATAPRPSFRRDASASRALFDRLDKNRDGYLTGAELTSPEALGSSWLGVDRNGDGRISRDEFTQINGVRSTFPVGQRE